MELGHPVVHFRQSDTDWEPALLLDSRTAWWDFSVAGMARRFRDLGFDMDDTSSEVDVEGDALLEVHVAIARREGVTHSPGSRTNTADNLWEPEYVPETPDADAGDLNHGNPPL